MSIVDINRIESNGSTALHVASSEGHVKIVELLLAKGASPSTLNKHNLTPLDLAETDQIKQFICHYVNKTRLVGDSVEWTIANSDADFQAHNYSSKLQVYGKDPHLDRLITYIKQNYIDRDLRHIEDIKIIKLNFNKALHEQDPAYLLKAYIAETGFCPALNARLAQLQLDSLTDNENLSLAYYVGIIAHHAKFETLSFTGTVFRGLIITAAELEQHTKGTRILTKIFSSASKQRHIVTALLDNIHPQNDRLTAVCTYDIRNQRTAFDIHYMSLFQHEEEVLLLPYSAFKIMDVQINKDNSPQVEIKFKECEPW